MPTRHHAVVFIDVYSDILNVGTAISEVPAFSDFVEVPLQAWLDEGWRIAPGAAASTTANAVHVVTLYLDVP